VAASADGTTWLLSADGPNGRLYELDPGDARAVERTQLLGTPTALAATGDALWVALDSGRSRIVRLTSSDTEVPDDEVVAETRGPVTALAVGGDHLWAYAAASGELLRVGLEADPPVTPVALSGRAGGDDAEARTASDADSDPDSDSDSGTGGGDGPGSAVHGPAALATSGDNVWVVDPGRDELFRIGAATARVVGRPFATGDQPAAVVRAGDALWVALAGERERRVMVSPLRG
jgi:hypothetical protein